MADQIQGEDATLQLYADGAVVRGLPIKSFRWKADDEIKQRDLLGKPRTTNQHKIHGYEGDFEVDVESGRDHELIELLNASDKSGVSSYELAIQSRENYRDGTSKRLRFIRVTVTIPETNMRGRKDDITRSYRWRAEDLVYLR